MKETILLLAALAAPTIVCGQNHSFGLVIQCTDYDSVKDQTTFHLLNVSGKQINALDLSLQVKLPDGTFTESGTTFAVIDYLDAGLAPGAIEDIQKPGIVIALGFTGEPHRPRRNRTCRGLNGVRRTSANESGTRTVQTALP